MFTSLLVWLALTLAVGAEQLSQEAYLWQRVWNEPVRDAVAAHGTNFSRLVPLCVEVGWSGPKPSVARAEIDYAALRTSRRPAGLAMRIGSFTGPFSAEAKATSFLTSLARQVVAEAQTNGVRVTELQIDFDCAESKLDGYLVWVAALRRAVSPLPLVITALPSWLKQPAFARLAAATDGYVLQVHSLERPKDFRAPFTLCDAVLARKAVEQASRLGVRFRVALPTYGYLVAFDREGKYLGISAEGPGKNWPAGAQFRTVQAEPAAIAGLVAEWQRVPPPAMTGLIWYRLPVEGEHLNWRWPTLAAVMAGRIPRAQLQAEVHQSSTGLNEIELTNSGDDEVDRAITLKTPWSGARLVASEALQGFSVEDAGAEALLFRADKFRLAPGQRRVIGWLRLNQGVPVTVELAP